MPLQPPIGLTAPRRDCIAACRPSCQPSCVDTCTNCVGLNGGNSHCPAFCVQSPGQFYPQPVFSQAQFQCADPCMPSCGSDCVRAYMVNPATPCYQPQLSPCSGE
uniref:Uncharacterized protein n=1 Tax=Ditylenchus dipsaci TaxID=166011 RepID=A0A915EPX0_9BILA